MWHQAPLTPRTLNHSLAHSLARSLPAGGAAQGGAAGADGGGGAEAQGPPALLAVRPALPVALVPHQRGAAGRQAKAGRTGAVAGWLVAACLLPAWLPACLLVARVGCLHGLQLCRPTGQGQAQRRGVESVDGGGMPLPTARNVNQPTSTGFLASALPCCVAGCVCRCCLKWRSSPGAPAEET